MKRFPLLLLLFVLRVLIAIIHPHRKLRDVPPLQVRHVDGRLRFLLLGDGRIIPAMAGADGGEEDEEVDEDDLPDAVKAILKKERKSRKDAERRAKDAENARKDADKRASDMEERIEQLEEDSGGGGGEPDEEAQRLVTAAERRATDAEKKAEEAAEREEKANKRAQRARLISELRDPEHGIRSDMIEIAAEQLDIEFDDDGEPIDVGDAVSDLLEERSGFRAEEPEPEPDPKKRNRPNSKRPRGGGMTREEVQRLASEDPDRFNEMFEAGEIPTSALGG